MSRSGERMTMKVHLSGEHILGADSCILQEPMAESVTLDYLSPNKQAKPTSQIISATNRPATGILVPVPPRFSITVTPALRADSGHLEA